VYAIDSVFVAPSEHAALAHKMQATHAGRWRMGQTGLIRLKSLLLMVLVAADISG
jgi:hypothetical protein